MPTFGVSLLLIDRSRHPVAAIESDRCAPDATATVLDSDVIAMTAKRERLRRGLRTTGSSQAEEEIMRDRFCIGRSGASNARRRRPVGGLPSRHGALVVLGPCWLRIGRF